VVHAVTEVAKGVLQGVDVACLLSEGSLEVAALLLGVSKRAAKISHIAS
jgi:hypothetical protein